MIYFYYGSDTFTLSRELKNLKQNFPGMVEEIEIGDFSDIDLKTRLTEVLQSQGLFSQDKLVFLKNFLGRIKDFPKSEEYLSNVIKNPSAAGLVFEQTDRFDKRLKFFKALQKSAEMRQFDIPTGPALEKWVENYLVYTGFKIEPLALREFVRLTSPEAVEENLYDLWQVANELEKLMLYHTPSSSPPYQGVELVGVISLADVLAIVRPNVSQNVFALTNLFAEGRAAEAQRYLEILIGPGPAADLKSQSIQIIGALAMQIRSLLLVKDLERETPAKIAHALGWKEGRVWINQKLARKFSVEKLAAMMADLRALDLRLKTSEEPPKLLLSLFLQKARAS